MPEVVVDTSDAAAARDLPTRTLPWLTGSWWAAFVVYCGLLFIAHDIFGWPAGASWIVPALVTWLPVIVASVLVHRHRAPARAARARVFLAVAARVRAAVVEAGLPGFDEQYLAVALQQRDNGVDQRGGPGPGDPVLVWDLPVGDPVPGRWLVAQRLHGTPERTRVYLTTVTPDIPTRALSHSL